MSDTSINNTTKQFLDKDGLNALWNKICNVINDNIITVKNDIPTSLPANGGNADTVDDKHASDFAIANHNHNITLNGSFTSEITATYDNGTLIISGSATNVQYTGTTDVENKK